jgi:hypothetical protein
MNCFRYLKLCLYIIVAGAFLSGCVLFNGEKKNWKPVKLKSSAFVHKVNWADETMSMISSWYTGKPENSGLIVAANPTLIPDKLTVGPQIFIPNELLVNREPMPRKYMDELRAKTESQSSNVKKPEKKQPVLNNGDFHLFGPR